MKRLTTDTPKDNFETMLNFVYGKDGWAHIRHDGENADVLLSEWARKQCLHRGCDEFPAESPEEIDQEICDCMMDFPDCPIALAYCFACQAVHLRDRLKMYEDILFSEDGKELISLEQLREIVSQNSNPTLTLEELREMDGEPVWIVPLILTSSDVPEGADDEEMEKAMEPFWTIAHSCLLDINDGHVYGITYIAYRKKPEEGTANG